MLSATPSFPLHAPLILRHAEAVTAHKSSVHWLRISYKFIDSDSLLYIDHSPPPNLRACKRRIYKLHAQTPSAEYLYVSKSDFMNSLIESYNLPRIYLVGRHGDLKAIGIFCDDSARKWAGRNNARNWELNVISSLKRNLCISEYQIIWDKDQRDITKREKKFLTRPHFPVSIV